MTSPVLTLLRKELLDVLRDRRTLLVTLLLPVLLYPGLLAVTGTVMATGQQRLARAELVVAVASDDAQAFVEAAPTPEHTSWVRLTRQEGEARLRAKTVAAVVDAKDGSFAAMKAGQQGAVQVLYTKKYDRSAEANARLKRLLTEVGKRALVDRLSAAQLPAQFAEPVLTESTDVDFQRNLGPLVASRALPLILLMMLFMGAMYPAVDLTAGEKERGTLETLLVAPVLPLDVMKAKYLTVALTATLATLANLTAMGVTFAVGITMPGAEAISMRLSALQVLTLVGCLVPAAFMAAGFSLAVASLARTFKEGQSLMTPVVLIATLPGIVAVMPGAELNALTAAIPLVNLGLLVKATVLGAASPLPVAIVLLSVGATSYLSLRLAANAFQSEALRFGGPESWRELFGKKR